MTVKVQAVGPPGGVGATGVDELQPAHTLINVANRRVLIHTLWVTMIRGSPNGSRLGNANIRRYGPAWLPALRSREPVACRVHGQGRRHRRALRPALRRVDRLPGAARRPDRQRVDSDRRARDLGAEEARRLDHPREQHRPDDRIGRRIGRRRRRVHDPGADLPDAGRPGVFQLLPDCDARLRRRHPRRADDGAAAPRADRQGARRAARIRKAPPAPTC